MLQRVAALSDSPAQPHGAALLQKQTSPNAAPLLQTQESLCPVAEPPRLPRVADGISTQMCPAVSPGTKHTLCRPWAQEHQSAHSTKPQLLVPLGARNETTLPALALPAIPSNMLNMSEGRRGFSKTKILPSAAAACLSHHLLKLIPDH